MPYFDVRNVRPGSIRDGIGTRSINLMCAILGDITYNELYAGSFHYTPQANPGPVPPPIPGPGPGLSVLDRIIRNVDALDPALQIGATTGNLIVKDKLIGLGGAFIRIKYGLAALGYPDIQLKTLFYTDLQTIGDEKLRNGYLLIIAALENVHEFPQGDPNMDQMFHFCVPFLTIQMGRIPADGTLPRPKRAPTASEFNNDFLAILGDLKMYQLYDVYQDDYQRRRDAAKRALDRCILREHGRQNRPSLLATQQRVDLLHTFGNNKHCASATPDPGTRCYSCPSPPNDHPEDWCNDYQDEEGVWYCSLGSDYHS